jgi:hypothetical protein
MSGSPAQTVIIEGPVRRIGSNLAVGLRPDLISDCRLRRARVRTGGGDAPGVVRRLNDGGVALLVTAAAAETLGLYEGCTCHAELDLLPQRPRTKIPPDLAAALAEANCDPSTLGEADLRHLVTLVLEAGSPAIRRARVEAFVVSRVPFARQTD